MFSLSSRHKFQSNTTELLCNFRPAFPIPRVLKFFFCGMRKLKFKFHSRKKARSWERAKSIVGLCWKTTRDMSADESNYDNR